MDIAPAFIKCHEINTLSAARLWVCFDDRFDHINRTKGGKYPGEKEQVGRCALSLYADFETG